MGNRIYKIIILTGLFFIITEQGQAKGIDRTVEIDTTIVLTLRFMQDMSEINVAMMGNQKTLNTLDSIAGSTSEAHPVHSVTIISFGLPEENAETNRLLATKRTEAARKCLEQHNLHLDYAGIKNTQVDAWTEIRRKIVNDSGVPDQEDVLAIIDYHRNNPAQLLKMLRYLNGGKPYRYLANKIFPMLNRVDVQITVDIPKVGISKAEPVVKVLPSMVDTSAVNETVKKIESEITAAGIEAKEMKSVQARRRTVLAIKNNLLYDLALAPNIEIELPLGRRWSLNTEYKCPWWLSNSRDFCYQLLSGGVEARCWLGNRKMRNRLTGHFIGLFAEGGIYDFQFGGDGYHGKYYGASGLTYGYTRQISRHFALEFSFGVGYLTTEYRKYSSYYGDLVWISSGRYNFLGPTKAKISLVWLLTTRR